MQSIPVERYHHKSSIRNRELTISTSSSNENTKPLYQQFLDESEHLGITIPDRSRYQKYIKILKDNNENISFRITASHEIFHLLVALKGINNIEEWRSTITDAIRYEAAIPTANTNQTKGRDTLFELYVAGRLSLAGITVSKGEPDILCNKNGFKFGIAAKRIKSTKKILIRAKEARVQIEKTKIPGIIALDLTPLHESYYSQFPIESINLIKKRAFEFLDQCFEPLLPEIANRCTRKHVLGIIAFTTMGALSDNNHTILIAPSHSGHRLCIPGSEKAKHMWEIVDLLSKNPAIM